MERYEEALADFNRSIVLDEKNAWILAGRGQTYRAMERYEEALADFNRAIVLDEKYTWALVGRGQTYCVMERYEEALADFNRAIELNEKYTWALVGRGQMYCAMERYEEALVDFDQAIALDEKSASALAGRGRTYASMGYYEEALADLKQAVDLGQDLMNGLGLVFSYLGRYAEAIECYQHDLNKIPDCIPVLYNTAVVMVYWKGFAHALEWVNKARASLVSTLDSGSKLYGLGGLEALVGDESLALDYLRQAVSVEKRAIDWARHDIAWRNLRSNNEFQAIISIHQ
jgi:tetratricopeptide (TPR) repeat protein